MGKRREDTDCVSPEMDCLLKMIVTHWRESPVFPTFQVYSEALAEVLREMPAEVAGLLVEHFMTNVTSKSEFRRQIMPGALRSLVAAATATRADLKTLGMNIDQPTEPLQKRKRTRFNRVRLYDNPKPPPPEPAPTPTRGLTEFPANWELGRTEIRVAREIAGWDEYKADEQFIRFRRWATHKGATSADWPEVWRTWCSNGKQYEAQRAKRGFR